MTTNYAHPVASPHDSLSRVDMFESKFDKVALTDYDPYLNGAASLHFHGSGTVRMSFLHGALPKANEQRPRWQATILGSGAGTEIFECAFDAYGKPLTALKDIMALRPDFKKLVEGIDQKFAERVLASFRKITRFVDVGSPSQHWELPKIQKPELPTKTAA